MKFRLKSGKLRHEGQQYVPGDIIVTDSPLDKIFPNTIELVEGEKVEHRNQPKLSSLPASLSGKEGGSPPPSFSFLDVTKEFDAGPYRVARKGKTSFRVYDTENKQVFMSNKKASVIEFLTTKQ